MYLYFSTGNGQPREPALCQLYRHTFVPYSAIWLSLSATWFETTIFWLAYSQQVYAWMMKWDIGIVVYPCPSPLPTERDLCIYEFYNFSELRRPGGNPLIGPKATQMRHSDNGVILSEGSRHYAQRVFCPSLITAAVVRHTITRQRINTASRRRTITR